MDAYRRESGEPDVVERFITKNEKGEEVVFLTLRETYPMDVDRVSFWKK